MAKNKGQSLIEVLIATAVGTILILAALTLIAPSLKTNANVARVQMSAAWGRELLDRTRVLADSDWNTLYGRYSPSLPNLFLVPGVNLTVVTGTETIAAGPFDAVDYWKFDEASGVAAWDFGSSFVSGTLMNGVNKVTGMAGMAIGLNGSSSYVEVPSSSSLKYAGGNFSVSLWVYPSSTESTGAYLISKPWNGSGEYNYYLSLSNTLQPNFQVRGASAYTVSESSSMTANTWHHLVGVASGTIINLYRDGQLVASGVHGISSWAPGGGDSNTPLAIGTLYPYGSGWGGNQSYSLNGMIDDVRIYQRALAQGEVEDLYKATVYTRTFQLDAAYRDGSGVLSNSGTQDPSALKITVTYGWQGGPTSSIVGYAVRNNNKIYKQSDWSGGISTSSIGFSTSSNITYSSSGSLYVTLP